MVARAMPVPLVFLPSGRCGCGAALLSPTRGADGRDLRLEEAQWTCARILLGLPLDEDASRHTSDFRVATDRLYAVADVQRALEAAGVGSTTPFTRAVLAHLRGDA